MQSNNYAVCDRLAALINILSLDWDDAGWFIAQLDYPANDDSAGRAFRRDIAALQALGFQIEEQRESNKPSYRLVGHKKWPRAAHLEQVLRPMPLEPRKVREG